MASPTSILISNVSGGDKAYPSGRFYKIKGKTFPNVDTEITLKIATDRNYVPQVGHVVSGWPDKKDTSNVNFSQAYDESRKLISVDSGKYAVNVKEEYWPGAPKTPNGNNPNTSYQQKASGAKSDPKYDYRLNREEELERQGQLRIQGIISVGANVLTTLFTLGREDEFEKQMDRLFKYADNRISLDDAFAGDVKDSQVEDNFPGVDDDPFG